MARIVVLSYPRSWKSRIAVSRIRARVCSLLAGLFAASLSAGTEGVEGSEAREDSEDPMGPGLSVGAGTGRA